MENEILRASKLMPYLAPIKVHPLIEEKEPITKAEIRGKTPRFKTFKNSQSFLKSMCFRGNSIEQKNKAEGQSI